MNATKYTTEKTAAHQTQIQPAISFRSLPMKNSTVYQTPLNELLLNIEDFSFEAVLPYMQQLQAPSAADKNSQLSQ